MKTTIRFGKKMKEQRPRIRKGRKEPTRGRNPTNPPQITIPWGRGASDYRPGLFTKQYFEKHGDICAADVFSALREELREINRVRSEIGEKPIRGCTYNSFAKYWHWFKILGLIESTGRTGTAIYDFLEKKRFFRMTDKGKIEVKAWEDPIMVAHPEFR
jgi:hypothetical protein